MNDEKIDELLERLEDINGSLDSISSNVGYIALYLWLPFLLVVGVGVVFVIGLLFFMANN